MSKQFSMPLAYCDAQVRVMQRGEEDKEDDNIVEVIVSTGAPVRRYDWANSRYYNEVLDMRSESINLDRLRGGAPVLDSHQGYTLENQLGRTMDPELREGKLYAKAKLSKRESVAGIVGDIKDGVITNISVGYSRDAIEMIAPSGKSGEWEYRVKKWTPFEVSFVPIPADPGAQSLRNENAENYPCEILNFDHSETRGNDMTDKDLQKEVIEAEQKRSADIIELCTKHNAIARAADFIKSGKSVQEVGLDILESMARNDSQEQRNVTQVRTVRDEHDVRMQGIQEALHHRLDTKQTLTDNGKRFRGMSLLEVGREYLRGVGVNTDGMDKVKVASEMLVKRSTNGAHTTSDFPLLLSALVNKRLRTAYEEAPGTFRAWAARASNAPDFKSRNILQLANAPDLQQVNEHGEFKYGTLSESGETYAVATYGVIVSLTRQAIINDDLGGFDRLITRFGAASERLQNQLVYAQLLNNANLADGGALFNSNALTTAGGHANLLSGVGSALSITSLSDARKNMRLQKGLQGENLNISPRYLLVPAALETTAQQLLSQQYLANQSTSINPFAGAFQLISDAILDSNSSSAWYLIAANSTVDTVEYCYLDGADGPVVESEIGFETDGVSYKVRLDFGTKAIDYRGMIKSNGA